MPEHDVTKPKLWLYERGAALVITEPTNHKGERPDAIAWFTAAAPHFPDSTVLIELKVTVSDALRNAKKRWHGAAGAGNHRFMWIPRGLAIPASILPPTWGLIVDGKITRHATWQPANREHEQKIKNREGGT